MSAVPREEQLVTKDFLRAELAELRGDLRGEMAEMRIGIEGRMGEMRVGIEGRLGRIESEISWVKWIITGGVGLYVFRSVVEWLR